MLYGIYTRYYDEGHTVMIFMTYLLTFYDFLEILKRMFQDFKKVEDKCFLGDWPEKIK